MLFRLKIEVSCYYYGDMISLEINQDILKIFGFLLCGPLSYIDFCKEYTGFVCCANL